MVQRRYVITPPGFGPHVMDTTITELSREAHLLVPASVPPCFSDAFRRVLLKKWASAKYDSRKLRIRGHKKPELLREPRHHTLSLLARLVRDYLSGCDLRWVRDQRGYMLCREISSLPVRLLLSLLVLKDAGRNHYAIPGVDPVVSHESRHFADHGQELLLHVPRHLFRVGHTLVAPYRSVHSFCTTSFALRSIPLTTIAGISGVGKSPSLTLW